MAVYQSYNNKTDTWVKFKIVKGKKTTILKSKKRNKTVKFKNVKVR